MGIANLRVSDNVVTKKRLGWVVPCLNSVHNSTLGKINAIPWLLRSIAYVVDYSCNHGIYTKIYEKGEILDW